MHHGADEAPVPATSSTPKASSSLTLGGIAFLLFGVLWAVFSHHRQAETARSAGERGTWAAQVTNVGVMAPGAATRSARELDR